MWFVLSFLCHLLDPNRVTAMADYAAHTRAEFGDEFMDAACGQIPSQTYSWTSLFLSGPIVNMNSS
jgi:hypothetical protein